MEKEDEPDHNKAVQLQQAWFDESIEIRVPALWRYEVGNVLGLKKLDMAVELMSALLAYEFDEVPLRTEYGLAVLEHMREVKQVTFFDSAYHMLAIRAKGVYVTADSDYVKRAKRKGHVALLRDWKAPMA